LLATGQTNPSAALLTSDNCRRGICALHSTGTGRVGRAVCFVNTQSPSRPVLCVFQVRRVVVELWRDARSAWRGGCCGGTLHLNLLRLSTSSKENIESAPHPVKTGEVSGDSWRGRGAAALLMSDKDRRIYLPNATKTVACRVFRSTPPTSVNSSRRPASPMLAYLPCRQRIDPVA